MLFGAHFLCYNAGVEQNYARLLETALDPARLDLMRRVAENATGRGLALYVVGGSVRDLMLGRPINDFDLTVEGDAIRLARELVHRYGGGVTVHTKFGTA